MIEKGIVASLTVGLMNNKDDDEIEFDTTLVPDDYDDEITPNYEDDSNFDHLTYDEVFDKSKNTLILFILSFILIEDEEKISESELFSALEEIGLYLDHKYEIAHDCARQNIRELISKEFIRKSFLKRTKKPNSDTSLPADYYYEWGIRSTFEFKRLDVLNFIKDIYNCDEVHMNLLFEKAKKMDQQQKKRFEKHQFFKKTSFFIVVIIIVEFVPFNDGRVKATVVFMEGDDDDDCGDCFCCLLFRRLR